MAIRFAEAFEIIDQFDSAIMYAERADRLENEQLDTIVQIASWGVPRNEI